MIVPVESFKNITKIYLPGGDWYHLFSGKKLQGGNEIFWECPLNYLPVFVAAGSILPMQSARQHADEVSDDRIKMHIFKGKGVHQQILYEDDGTSFAYQRGDWAKRIIQMDHDHGILTIGPLEGEYASDYSQAKIYFHGFPDQQVEVDGNRVKMERNNVAFLDEIAEFDPLPDGTHDFQICASVPSVTVALTAPGQTITLKGIE